MSRPYDPTTFFAAVAEFNDNAKDEDTARKLLLGTVSALPSGLVQVIFDGETVASSKPYGYVGQPPAIGSRVVLMPIANTHVVMGELNAAAVVQHPRQVGVMRKTTNSPQGNGTAGGLSAVKVMNVSAPVKAGRHYSLEMINLGVYSDNACQLRAVMTYTTDGSEPIQTKTVIQIGQIESPAGGRVESLDVVTDYKPVTDHTLRVGICMHATLGTGNWGSYGYPGQWTNILRVMDIGPALADNGSSF